MDGYWNKTVPVRIYSGITAVLIGALLVLMTAQVGAQGEDEITFADLALLEFLVDWETEEGEWLDPMLFDDKAFRNKAPVVDRSMTDGHREELEMNQEKRQNPFTGREKND